MRRPAAYIPEHELCFAPATPDGRLLASIEETPRRWTRKPAEAVTVRHRLDAERILRQLFPYTYDRFTVRQLRCPR
jgi:hypothetical protein